MIPKMILTKTRRFRRKKDLWCEYGDKYPLGFNVDFAGAIILSEEEYNEDETIVKLVGGFDTLHYIDPYKKYPCCKKWYGTIIEEFTGVFND